MMEIISNHEAIEQIQPNLMLKASIFRYSESERDVGVLHDVHYLTIRALVKSEGIYS